MKQQLMFHYDETNDTRWRNVAVGPLDAPGAKDSAERDGMDGDGGREWPQLLGPNPNFIRKLIGIFVFINMPGLLRVGCSRLCPLLVALAKDKYLWLPLHVRSSLAWTILRPSTL